MLGLMMDSPLLTTEILRHAVRNHHQTEIVTRTVEGPIHRYTVADSAKRIAQLAHALIELGVKPGDRVGVIGWNTHRQFEFYYAVGGIGAVLHTINPRLGPQNAAYVINHAEDTYLFYDNTFAPLVAALAPSLSTVRYYAALTDREHAPDIGREAGVYEELIAEKPTSFEWPSFDENTAAAMCYTSGTTGDPKGVLYSHRALVLQAFGIALPNSGGGTEAEVIMPIVPMFHVNAWNSPYSSMLQGLKQVFPGPRLDGEGLYELIEAEGVTYSIGVPTVWLGLLQYVEKTDKRFSTFACAMSGGAAMNEGLVRGMEERGVHLQQGWGMTEMTPVGTVNKLPPEVASKPIDERIETQLYQGRSLPLVEMRLVAPDGKILPHDGVAEGHLQVRGPWVVKGYYKVEKDVLTADGWFDTGDVAIIHPDGMLQITDRSKDVIKTGGEWVSSIEIENAAQSHPGVYLAAVIGVHHPKWQERPLLIVQRQGGTKASGEEIRQFVAQHVDKIAIPDAVEFIDEIPLGPTGKILKTVLRKQFKDYKLPA